MDNDIQNKINILKMAYAGTLNQKIIEIHAAWKALKSAWHDDALTQVHRLVHNLHGSSGTYGYQEIAHAAGELELMLAQCRKQSPLPATIEALDTRMQDLLQCMGSATVKRESESEILVNTGKKIEKIFYILHHTNEKESLPGQMNPLAYLCHYSQDKKFDDDASVATFGYKTFCFDEVSSFLQAIENRTPDALMIPIDQLNEALTRDLHQFSQDYPASLILVNAREGQPENRLKAVRAGAEAYMLEPFTLEELLSRLDDFFKVKKVDYNILIVDDSPDVAEYYALILKQAGMNVAVICDPMLIDQSLFSFNPDLILMDMYMPDCNGLEVAAIIRQQENYASIPIVFLSSEEDREKQLKAMRLGVDDFISKSTRTDFLILSIINRVERYRLLRSLITKDSLTGVLNHTEIQKRLNIHLKEASRLKIPLCIVMIDLDHFKGINDNYGHQMGDRVLKNLCLMLKKRLRASDEIGRQGGEEFLIILPNTSLDNARSIVDSLREQFSKISYVFEDEIFHVTFSAGIAQYPDYLNNNTLIHAADLALYAAKKWGRNRVCLAGS